jgi:hypothetical protein
MPVVGVKYCSFIRFGGKIPWDVLYYYSFNDLYTRTTIFFTAFIVLCHYNLTRVVLSCTCIIFMVAGRMA